jgi:hypothetical protein
MNAARLNDSAESRRSGKKRRRNPEARNDQEEERKAKKLHVQSYQTSDGGAITSIPIRAGLRNQPVPVDSLPVPDYPLHLFKLHTLAAFIGIRGSGKTNAVVLLAKEYCDFGSFNRVFILSPTYKSNPVFKVLPVKKKDVYTDLNESAAALQDIEEKIKKDKRDYEEYQEYMAAYKRWRKGKSSELDDEMLAKYQHRQPEPVAPPSPLIIVDDMSHSDIYSERNGNPFINLALRHRHLGCSIFMCLQNFKSRGGLPKCLRENIQQFFIWRTQDRRALESTWQEFANVIDYDRFLALYHVATDDNKHNFLTVDQNAPTPQVRFRRNFDEILVP